MRNLLENLRGFFFAELFKGKVGLKVKKKAGMERKEKYYPMKQRMQAEILLIMRNWAIA